MADLAVYAGLFLTAFIAATILPMQSEAALAGLIILKSQPVWLLVAVASVGNVAGSFANWLLGVALNVSGMSAGFRSGRRRCNGRRTGTGVMANGPCCSAGRRSSGTL